MFYYDRLRAGQCIVNFNLDYWTCAISLFFSVLLKNWKIEWNLEHWGFTQWVTFENTLKLHSPKARAFKDYLNKTELIINYPNRSFEYKSTIWIITLIAESEVFCLNQSEQRRHSLYNNHYDWVRAGRFIASFLVCTSCGVICTREFVILSVM